MTSPDRPLFIERGIRQEQLDITAQSFWIDNDSPEAKDAREEFTKKEEQRELWAVEGCADARTLTSTKIAIRKVAAASDPAPRLASDKSIGLWIADSHFDSDIFEIGKTPTGCGGLGAKLEIGNNRIQEPGVYRFASEEIADHDPVKQAIVTARNIFALSHGKPVLATLQDHRTFHIYPLAFFQVGDDGEEDVRSAVLGRYLDPKHYDPGIIYANGIPSLKEYNLPENVQAFLRRHRKLAQQMQGLYPDLHELQGVQKPRMVLLTTDRRSARQKFPKLASVPGSMFKITLFTEGSHETVQIGEKETEAALDQLSYPIRDKCLLNYGDPTKPFSNTDKIIIETPNIELSRLIAGKALQETWIKQWLELPERRIILLQTNDGIVNDVEELPKAA